MIDEEKMKEMSEGMHKERMERCVPVAQEVLKLIAGKEASAPLGDIVDEDRKWYSEIGLEVIQLFLDRKVHFTDRTFIFQLAMQAIEQTRDAVTNSVELSFDKAMKKMWTKDMDEVTMNDIDAVLKTEGQA